MNLHLHTVSGIQELDAPEDATLAQAVWLRAGLAAPPLCGGLGRCGLCRVRLLPAEAAPEPLELEREVLGGAVRHGWRLACRRSVREAAGLTVVVPESASASPLVEVRTALSGELLLAVDLGTTSIHWRALNRKGEIPAAGRALNPQCGAGSDVVSRLAAAATTEGRALLSGLVRNFIKKIVAGLEESGAAVTELCLAANPAMSAIFLNTAIDGLLAAPYSRPVQGGCRYTLPDLPPVWLPPQPAPFVGGDLCAAVASALRAGAPFPFLLADMGTNGECALVLDEHRAFLASVPLGPALEGIGLSCGVLAGPGSVTAFSLSPQGLTPTVMGGGPALGLCGTGALSLIDTLLRAGVLSREGLPADPDMPLGRRVRSRIRLDARGWRLPLPGSGLFLTGEDVEAVLKVRAAFAVAVASLLEAAGLEPREVRAFLLAGSLGEHAPADMLERLGFIPPGLAGRTRSVGNAALDGAALFLLEPVWRERMADWSARCALVEVTGDPRYMDRFVDAMRFPQG